MHRAQDSLELSSVAATEDPNTFLLVSVFEIPARDLPVFFAREDFFLIKQVRVAEYPTGSWEGILSPGYAPTVLARMCCKFDNDEALVAARFGDRTAFEARFRAHYNGKIYRSDILPCRPYLKHCLVAAERLGSAFRANFEQSSFLADGSGTIADYLAARPGWDEQTPLGTYDRYQG